MKLHGSLGDTKFLPDVVASESMSSKRNAFPFS